MEQDKLSYAELVEFAVEALCDLHGHYTAAEIQDQVNQYHYRVGDMRSLELSFQGARENLVLYEAALLSISHWLCSGIALPHFVFQWLYDYRGGKIKKPNRSRRHSRAFPGQDTERNKGIYQIVCDLESMGVPRRASIHEPAFSCYEIVAKAQRELRQRPNSANGIRKICEARAREIKEGRISFSQMDAYLALIGAKR